MSAPQKLTLVGAGAIGTWLGVHLVRQAGVQVSVLARPESARVIAAQGLRLETAQGLLQTPVAVHSDAAAIGVQDWVIVSVKGPAMADVARSMKPLIGPHTRVLTAMNGLPWWFCQGLSGSAQGMRLACADPEGAIEAVLQSAQVIGGVVHASCINLGPGHARHAMGQGLILGAATGEAHDARVDALVALLKQCGFDATASSHIQRDVWYKLWGNMTVNPVSALTGATTDLLMNDPLLLDFISRIMIEAREVGARIGLPIAQEPEDRHQITRKLGAFKTSMLQDVEAQRPIELDALVEAVREIAARVGVQTPFTDALMGLTRVLGQVRGLY